MVVQAVHTFVRGAAGSLAAVIVFTVGCGGAGAPPKPEIDPPDLSRLEPGIAGRLEADRQRVIDSVGAGGLSAAEAGESVGKLGMVFQAHGLDDPAADCYRYSMGVQPYEARWSYLLGRVELDSGNGREALAHLEAAARLDPEDTPAAFYAGVAQQQLGEIDGAATWFGESIERDPRCAAAHYRLAQLEVDRQNLERAVEEYLVVLSLQPAASRVHAALAALFRRLGEATEAKAHLARAGDGSVKLTDPIMGEIALLSLSTNELLNRGGAAFNQQRYGDALVWYRRAVEIEPDDADVRLGLGSVLMNLGELDEARQEFDAAVSLAPSNSRARFNLGTLLARTGDDRGAIGEYRLALGIDVGYVAAHLNLGNALLRVGEAETAAGHFATVNRLDPNRPSARLAETVALSLAGRWELAFEKIEEAHRLFPQDRAITAGLARLLAACPVDGMRNGPRSVDLSEGLIGAASQLDAVESLAMAYAEVGRYDDAVVAQTKALDAVKRSGRSDLERVMESRLEAYSRREPCRLPWTASTL